MAVQAQYDPNTLFITRFREEQEMKDVDFPRASTGFIDQPIVLFNNGDGNSRKRIRESIVGIPEPMMTLTQLQTSPLVSTSLRLAFDNNWNSNPLLSSTSTSSNINTSAFSAEFAAQISQQNHEIEQLIIAQGENLRRNLANKRHCHLRALLATVEESTMRRLQSKEGELQLAIRRQAELEDRIARLRAESMTWQTKAVANQATVASLHTQLQAAASAQPKPDELGGSNRAEDVESAYVDPDRIEPARACRTCLARPANVVLLPCRHLCSCAACDAAAGPVRFCPVCRTVRNRSVQVFMD